MVDGVKRMGLEFIGGYNIFYNNREMLSWTLSGNKGKRRRE